MAASLIQKHLRAIELRKQGWSYSQIKRELQVSKSSLSLWLKRHPLSKQQIDDLSSHNDKRIERFRETWRRKRVAQLREVYEQEKESLLPLTGKELLIAGLFLYSGEGAKGPKHGIVSLSNTNPTVIRFFLYWLTEILGVSMEKIFARLHVYADMDIAAEIDFWGTQLDLPVGKFRKPYVKKTTLRGLTYKSIGHGTCNLIVYSQSLLDKILMGIEVISDYHRAGV